MATAASLSVNLSEFGRTTTVPDDDVARLMYYLNCVTVSLGLDILHDDLVNYQSYRSLSPLRIALVFKSAVEFSPEIFNDKLIFRDDAGEIVPYGSSNKFVNITTAMDMVSVQRDFIVGGQVKDVTKVMFYKSSWLSTFYTGPVERIAKAVLAATSKHCEHCEGESGICGCSSCPRTSDSLCRPLFENFFDALINATTTTARARSPAPPPLPPRNQHQANCDGCGWQLFTGPRYKCVVCYDFDLCEGCYRGNKHANTQYTFKKYETPDDSPIYLAPRSTAPPPPPPVHTPAPPPPPYYEATRATPAPTPRANPAPPQPGPPMPPRPSDIKSPLPAAPSFDPNALFYLNMSITELKNFLTERDVEAGDILDKETLCKRVWETHCDCMSISELNTFLSKNGISTAGCRDVNARRQKARDAYKPPSRPVAPPLSSAGSSGGWRKDDVVVLTGLSKADMNGRKGTIQSVDAAQGKVTVFVDDMGRPFKVKYENITPYVEELGEADEAEELS